MKIAFHANHPYWGGLNNNGGSRTILKSIEALNELGHEAYIITHTDNFTWFKHDKPAKKIRSKTDLVVAVSIHDIKYLRKYKCKKAYWARPFEKWQMKIEKIEKTLKTFRGMIFVNSDWQKQWLKARKIKSHILYQGIDSFWRNLEYERFVAVGSIKTSRKTKNMKEAKAIFGKLDVNTYLFRGKNPKEMRSMYNTSVMWLCPTKREGLHNVALEAAMCGCLLVVSNRPKNGCMDFCNEDTAIIYNSIDDAVKKIYNYDINKVKKMQEYIKHKIGTRKENMKQLVKYGSML